MESIQKSRLIVGVLLALALLLIVNLSEAAVPGQPTPTSPENWENINDNTPVMIWDNNDVADNYYIQIDDNSDYSSPNVDNDNVVGEENQYTVPAYNALPDGVYYWRVRGENADGPGPWSDNYIFRVDTVAPAAPSLTSPENNENTNDNTPNLTWGTVSENSLPVLYYVAVSDNLEFPYENDNSGVWIEDDNYQLTTELTDGTWYWHVRAKDNAGNIGDNSENWIFRVDNLMPELLSPANGENTTDNRPTFSWENAVVADNYELQIDNQDNFQAPLIYDNDNITDNQHELPVDNALSDGTYYWRVIGYEGGDNSISSVRSFRVDNTAPAAPSLTSPDNNENTNDNTPNLTWSAVSDDSTPVLYYAAVSDNSQFPYENYNSGWIDDDNYQLTSELAEGTWYWRVGAKDNLGTVGDNSQRSFRVDVTPPTISGITESSVGQTSATINWTTDEPATSVVEYGTTTSYGTTQSDNSLVTSHSITLTNLLANTTYHYRVKSTDAANNTSTSSDQQFTTSPLIAPTSSVDNITPYWQTSTPFTITATASDNDGTVDNVTLWYRYRENSGENWGSWDNFGVDNSSPWSWAFDAPDNDGHYEFYTRATDNDDQTEAAPATADENAGLDTVAPTISSFQINGENTVTPSTSVVISIVAQDNLSGLDQMRFSNDNENWTDWEPFASENDYVLPAGDENKRVYVKVKDNAGLESAVVDNWIVLDTGVYVESLGTIAENENTLADFGQFGLLVTGINLFAKDNIENVEVEVKVVQEKPAEVSEAAPGTATYYFEVETNAPADNLDNVEIRFDVAKSWLDSLGIGAADVKLWKLDNTWQEVSTTIVGENASHVHFSATVPSLSWFAVTGEKPAAPIPYWAVAAGAIIIVVISIVLIWWWKKQAHSSAHQGTGVVSGSQARSELALNRKEP